MSKHVLDRPRRPSQDRLAQFVTIARAEGPHPATRMLQRRPGTTGAAAQTLAIYTRLDRRPQE